VITARARTALAVRSSTSRLLDHDYLVSHTTEDALTWGMKSEWQNETRLRFADPGRTVVDILDDPGLAGGIRHVAEILAAYLEDGDPATLVDYSDRLGNRSVFKRLGFIVETLGLDVPDLVAECATRLSEGISALDPRGPRGGRRTMRWRLRVNVTLGPQEPS
jgi:predicted transcriptional regulator of viral defense system